MPATERRGYDWIVERLCEFVTEAGLGGRAHQIVLFDHQGLALVRLVLPPDERQKQYRHSADFGSIVWAGKPYTFTATQARAVAILWAAHANGTPDVLGAAILDAVGLESQRVSDLFRGSEAWEDRVIAPGAKKGSVRLRTPEEFRENADEIPP